MTKSKEQKPEKEELSDLTAEMIKRRDEMLLAVTALISEIGPQAQTKGGEHSPADHEEYVRGFAALCHLDGLLRRTNKRNYTKNIDYAMPRFVTKDQLAVLQKGGIGNLKECFEHSLFMIKGMFSRSDGTPMPIVLGRLHEKMVSVSIPGPESKQGVWSSMTCRLGGQLKAPAP